MKLKKKIVIPVVLVAVAAAAVILAPRILGGGDTLPSYEATSLARMDLKNTVSVTGTVKSEDEKNVYSTLAYQIKSVNVKVGDVVKEGDVLCELDTTDIIANIQRQTATLSSAQAKAQHGLAVAQNQLETQKFNQENKYDAQVANAESAIVTAELNVESAKTKLESDRRAMSDFRDINGSPSNYSYQESSSYEGLKSAVLQDQISIEKAEKALEDAKAALATAKVLQKESLISGQDQVDTAKLNTNFEDQWMQINQLKEDLEDAIVKAPVSGTVTAVFAKEGGSGQGMLFVIEDTGKLKIDTKIKEYDIAAVTTGLTAVIKSDGTGEDEYSGKVAKIAPTAVKAANGETAETTDVEFETEIGVAQAGTRLKIGMKARVEIITQEKPDVFAVPFDSVVENENGESVVYVAKTVDAPVDGDAAKADAGPRTTAEPVTVTTGLETDFYIEISSDALNEGDLIISNPEGITAGMEIMLANQTDPAAAAGRGGPGGPGMAVRMGG